MGAQPVPSIECSRNKLHSQKKEEETWYFRLTRMLSETLWGSLCSTLFHCLHWRLCQVSSVGIRKELWGRTKRVTWNKTWQVEMKTGSVDKTWNGRLTSYLKQISPFSVMLGCHILVRHFTLGGCGLTHKAAHNHRKRTFISCFQTFPFLWHLKISI